MSPETVGILTAISNWVIAVANVTLFVTGFRALGNDRRRIIKMEQAEQQKYAENVYAWIEERSTEKVKIYCRNGSTSVIYNVHVVIVDDFGNALGNSYEIELMKPHEEKSFIVEHKPGIAISGVNVAFRDPRGLRWRRYRDGKLFEYTESSRPVDESNLLPQNMAHQLNLPSESKRRSLVKMVIWRVIGILWTWIGAWLILSLVPSKYSSATMIATLIVIYHHSTRTFMYYFYERIWLKVRWGRSSEGLPLMSIKDKVLWGIGILIAVSLILYVLMHTSPSIASKKP